MASDRFVKIFEAEMDDHSLTNIKYWQKEEVLISHKIKNFIPIENIERGTEEISAADLQESEKILYFAHFWGLYIKKTLKGISQV